MKDEIWRKLEWLLSRFIDANDLDKYAIEDPVRAAAFGWYVAKHSEDIGEWDVRTFVEYHNRQIRLK